MENNNKYLISIIFYCILFCFLGFGYGREVGISQYKEICISSK